MNKRLILSAVGSSRAVVFGTTAAIAALLLALLPIRTGADLPTNVSYQFTTFKVPNEAPPSAHNGGTSVLGINGRGDLVGNFGSQQQVLGSCNAGSQLVAGFLFAKGAFTNVSIPSSPLEFTELLAINDYGNIVGDHLDCNFNAAHFLLTKDGKIQFLPPVAPGALGVAESIGINNQGIIAGTFTLNPKLGRAGWQGFIFQGGVYNIFNLPNAHGTRPSGINEHGVITGTYYDANEVAHGFIRSADGSFISIAVPGAVETTARGINNAGAVVGFYVDTGGVDHGFVFTKGVYTTLDFPGASDTIAFGINDHGEIVGTYNGSTAGFTAGPMPTRTPMVNTVSSATSAPTATPTPTAPAPSSLATTGSSQIDRTNAPNQTGVRVERQRRHRHRHRHRRPTPTRTSTPTPTPAPTPTPVPGNNTFLTGLYAYYKLDEATGNAIDSSANGRTLAPAGAGNLARVAGVINTARNFPGDSHFFRNSTTEFSPGSNHFFFSFWARAGTLNQGGDASFMGRYNLPYAAEWLVYFDPTTHRIKFIATPDSTNVAGVISTTAFANTTNWYFIAGGWDGTNLKISVNGEPYVTTSFSRPVFQGSTNFNFGSESGLENQWVGQIDEAAIWIGRNDLTISEVQQLYNNGAGLPFSSFH